MRRRFRTPRGGTDNDAFAESVLGLLPPLFALALRLTRSRPDAEDLVQDTVVKALRFADRFEPGTNLKAWLFTILHNTWKNRVRAASREPVDVDSARLEDEAVHPAGVATPDTPEQLLLRGTLDADIQAALDQLPEAFREAVLLRDVEELSYADIATMLGIPVGTVMSRISRGRRQLFERLIARDPRTGNRAPAPGGQEPTAEGREQGAGRRDDSTGASVGADTVVGNDTVVGAGFRLPTNAGSRNDA